MALLWMLDLVLARLNILEEMRTWYYCCETWTHDGITLAAATHKKKKSPGPLIKVFHQTAATHERFFHPIDARCVFFHYPLMNIETALTHEKFSLHTLEGWANAMPTWFRVPWAVDLNICLLDKQAIQESIITHSLSTHEPLLSHSWTTQEVFPLGLGPWRWPKPLGPSVISILSSRCQRKPLQAPTHDPLMNHS